MADSSKVVTTAPEGAQSTADQRTDEISPAQPRADLPPATHFLVIREFSSCMREAAYKASLGHKHRRTDIAVNLLFCGIVCVATVKLHFSAVATPPWQLASLWALQAAFVALAFIAVRWPDFWARQREPLETAILLFQIWLSRSARSSIMSHTEGAQVDWPDFWVALLLWGPDTQGQLLKAAGFTFRAAAAVPTALIHFMVSVEGYSALQQQVQTTYPAQLAACVAAVRNGVRLLLPPAAARAVQPYITARTFCYGVWAAMGSAVYLAIAARAAQRDRNDRLAFLQSSAACQDTPCDCPLCSTQPSTKPAYHVTAYMIVGLLLPWYAAVVHEFVLASA